MKFDIDAALTRDEALGALTSRWSPRLCEEAVPAARACGRVLARDCHARYDLPRHRVSSFDGIAVRSTDFADGMPDTAGWKLGRDYVRADTGDDFPDEFDAVVAIEDVELREDGSVAVDPGVEVRPGLAVKPAGATMADGELLYRGGTLLTPEAIALLAAGGWAEVPVLRRLRVGYVPTGTELVSVGVEPTRGQNVQTNSLALGAYCAQWGADLVAYDIVADDRDALAAALDRALAECDLVLVNGGSSRGSEDFNSELLAERASFFAHGVRAVPGRPIGLAIVGGKPAVNVPGPMIAALLAADWLVHGLVCHGYGQPLPRRVAVPAVLDAPLGARPGFEQLARLVLAEHDGVLHAAPVPAGATLAQNVGAVNGFVAVPAGERWETGSMVDVEVLGTVAPML
ncbi:molybdopterin molybdotransferase MoeA [Adlercreutzia faecimuris]|uniref:Molybdopterin molybdenumtransferase n=1 Tax=Adlercreutzia faecimuris TaxID=2897341 RepID=A0ABS9WGN8_9ACTN|nr:molybdopterin molybdotransferase MoeA [Adlercreutzia sp. JBNU-10]MCI2241637.1 molybdopterin molybdotransferase MoeA [Adlercreutzia sp. JBNU-10]